MAGGLLFLAVIGLYLAWETGRGSAQGQTPSKGEERSFVLLWPGPFPDPGAWYGVRSSSGFPDAPLWGDWLYESLLKPSPEGWQPGLAVSMEKEGEGTYTLRLDPHATWSDGSPLTAEDVARAIMAVRDDPQSPYREAALALREGGIGWREEGGESLLTLSFENPPAGKALFALLTMGIGPGPERPGLTSGPYAMEKAGNGLRLTPRREGLPPVELRPLSGEVSLKDLGGRFHAFPLEGPGFPKGVDLWAMPRPSLTYLALNARVQPVNTTLTLPLRQALRASLAPMAGKSQVPFLLPAVSPLPRGNWAAPSLEVSPPAGDPQRLFQEAGVDPRELKLPLAYLAEDPYQEELAREVAAALAKQGVEVDLTPMDAPTFARQVFLRKSFALALLPWSAEGEGILPQLLWPGSLLALTGGKGEKLQALGAWEGEVPELPRLLELYRQAWDEAEAQALLLPLRQLAQVWAAAPGIDLSPLGFQRP
ncbi:MAG: hypothetical protein KM310_03250 [Clostridiales bacterium]|nr:hypothetical protein [Clostridiales bacterium]